MTPPSRRADLTIGSLAIRGRGLSAQTGRSLAGAVAEALAAQLPAQSTRLGRMAIRLPASVLDARGKVDDVAVAAAVARIGKESDA